MSGWERVARYIESHPGATAMDLIRNCGTTKYTSRITDARNNGWIIDCDMKSDPPSYTARKVGQGDATCAPSRGGEPVSRTDGPTPGFGDSAPMSCLSPSQGILDF